MKVNPKNLFALMLREIDSIKINGKSLYLDEDEYGCDFIYDGKRMHFSYDNSEPVTDNASCQRLCDKIIKYFKFE